MIIFSRNSENIKTGARRLYIITIIIIIIIIIIISTIDPILEEKKKQWGGRVALLIKQCEYVYLHVIMIITFLFVCFLV